MEDILYVGDGFAVVRKKIGEVCESTVKKEGVMILADRVRPVLEARLDKPLPFIEAVHRLDQPVSGCVLLALDKDSFTSLTVQFTSGRIRKRYLAVVEKPEAPLESSAGRLEDYLYFDKRNRKARIVVETEAKRLAAKRAVLEWSLIGEGDRYLFISVEPKTGRTHQIRAQLAAHGLTIKGDLKYGAKRSELAGGIRLHAYTVQFKSPKTGDIITISCPPSDPDPLWQALMEKLGE